MRRALAFLIALAGAGASVLPAPSPAGATQTGPAAVAHRVAFCNVTMSPLTFAAFSPATQSGRLARADITFDCASPVLAIEVSSGASGEFGVRRMTADGNARAGLVYNVFLDVSCTQVFGDGTGGSAVYRPGANVSHGTFPVYAEIAAGQGMPRAGTYVDQLFLSVDTAQ